MPPLLRPATSAPPGAPALRRQVGYVTQAPSVYADLTVRANLNYFSPLARVGLSALADAPVSSLSGGQRSPASLACALVGDPKLLVLDEPTVGLDPVTRESLWELFRELAGTSTDNFNDAFLAVINNEEA